MTVPYAQPPRNHVCAPISGCAAPITPWPELQLFYEYAYQAGSLAHSGLRLNFSDYAARLDDVLNRYLPRDADKSTVVAFFEKLHTADLYLATACALMKEGAWERFYFQFSGYIERAAACTVPTSRMAKDLADNLTGHLCLPDASGRSRIASFDGRSSLGFWLTVIVKRMAIREQQRRRNRGEDFPDHLDVADQKSIDRLDAQVRKERYQRLIRECLMPMTEALSPRELLILQLRYLRELKASEIANLLEVHRSSVTRQLERTHAKLKETILARLRTHSSLSDAAIEECLVEMIEDPEYASLALATLF